MKNIRIIILFFILLFLTGCVKYELKMDIQTDKSIDIKLISAIKNEYYNQDEKNSSKELYEKKGYEVTEYKDSDYKGMQLNKKFNSIDDVSNANVTNVELTSLLDKDTDKLELFNVTKNGSITTYMANFTFDLTAASANQEISEKEYSEYSEYYDDMIFKYSVIIPTNATIISENSDEKSNNGHELIWNMKYGDKKKINFTFNIDQKSVTQEPMDKFNEEVTSDISEEEVIDTNNSVVKEQKSSLLEMIVSFVFIIVIILGFIFLKIKLLKGKKKYNYNNRMHHDSAPNNMKK